MNSPAAHTPDLVPDLAAGLAIDTEPPLIGRLDRSLSPRLDTALAVLPPQIDGGPQAQAVADLVAEVLINTLGGSSQLRVVSHRSSQSLRRSDQAVRDACEHLQATHVLTGQGTLGLHDRVVLRLTLHTLPEARVLWSDRIEFHTLDLLSGDADTLAQACTALHGVLQRGRLDTVRNVAWQQLSHYELLSAATQWMYRLSPAAFEQSHRLLGWLTEQAPCLAEPHAWLAKWHLLAFTQGHAPRSEALAGLDRACDAALQRDARCALALSLRSHAAAVRGGSLQQAAAGHEAALLAQPNNALSWAFHALNRVYVDQPFEAREAARMALGLSPLDPWRHFLDSVLAHACLANGEPAVALQHARQAERLRNDHVPNALYLAVAHAQLGDSTQARAAVQRLLSRWPDFRVQVFRSSYWGRDASHAEDFARALRDAGLPD